MMVRNVLCSPTAILRHGTRESLSPGIRQRERAECDQADLGIRVGSKHCWDGRARLEIVRTLDVLGFERRESSSQRRHQGTT